MDHRFDVGVAQKRENAEQVFDMRMYAAVGYQSHQVQAGGAIDQRLPRRQLLECPAINRIGDPHQVLFEDAAGAERQVSNLGIAELAVRQTHRPSGRLQYGVWIGGEVMVEVRRARQRPRIVRATGVEAEPVENSQ